MIVVRGFGLRVVGLAAVLAPRAASGQAAPVPYQNVLDRRGSPEAMRDTGPEGHQRFSPLFDLGSWHGYLLPDGSGGYGGFPGPLVVAEEYSVYLARELDRLVLRDAAGRDRVWAGARVRIASRPGVLTQEYDFDDLSVALALRMASSRSAAVVTTLRNRSGHAQTWRLVWRGALLETWDRTGHSVAGRYPEWRRTLTAVPGGVDIALGRLRDPTAIMFSDGAGMSLRRSVPTRTRVAGTSYESESGLIPLAPGGTFTALTIQTFTLDAREWGREAPRVDRWLANAGASAAIIARATDRRWSGYLTRAWHGVARDSAARRLTQKAVETLIGNWRSPAGALLHDAIVPSTVARWFNGVWAWDSWKHAAALAHVDPGLGRRSVEAMFDYQIRTDDPLRPQDAGMIPDAIFFNRDSARGGDGLNWNERNSKPPLATWAVWTLHRAAPDPRWLARMYPRLVAYHEWWWRRRDPDANGLAAYGATAHSAHVVTGGALRLTLAGESAAVSGIAAFDSLRRAGAPVWAPVIEAAGWESGMDGAARFGGLDSTRERQYADVHCHKDIGCARRDWTPALREDRDAAGTPLGYTLAQESVDLNAFLAADAAGLSLIATALGHKADAARWASRTRALGTRVQRCFWDPDARFFFDRDVSNTASDSQGCTGRLLSHRGRGAEAWSVLWSGWASPAQAQALGEAMEDAQAFGGGLPLPTAARDNPGFGPQIYWRGRVWVDQLFFGLDGLRRAGDRARADRLWRRFLNGAGGLAGEGPVNENYDPDSGAPLGAPHFSWTAAHLLLWLEGSGSAPRLP